MIFKIARLRDLRDFVTVEDKQIPSWRWGCDASECVVDWTRFFAKIKIHFQNLGSAAQSSTDWGSLIWQWFLKTINNHFNKVNNDSYTLLVNKYCTYFFVRGINRRGSARVWLYEKALTTCNFIVRWTINARIIVSKQQDVIVECR